jgi:hypothetical protein
MKKLIVFLTLALVISLTSFSQGSQGSLREFSTLTADSITGAGDALTVYSTFLGPYWDYSIQFKSTFYNSGAATAGDSSYFAVAAYRTNDINASVWEEITAERDTLKTNVDVQGITVALYDFTGTWLKFILTGISLDTVLIVPYEVKKLKVTLGNY